MQHYIYKRRCLCPLHKRATHYILFFLINFFLKIYFWTLLISGPFCRYFNFHEGPALQKQHLLFSEYRCIVFKFNEFVIPSICCLSLYAMWVCIKEDLFFIILGKLACVHACDCEPLIYDEVVDLHLHVCVCAVCFGLPVSAPDFGVSDHGARGSRL